MVFSRGAARDGSQGSSAAEPLGPVASTSLEPRSGDRAKPSVSPLPPLRGLGLSVAHHPGVPLASLAPPLATLPRRSGLKPIPRQPHRRSGNAQPGASPGASPGATPRERPPVSTSLKDWELLSQSFRLRVLCTAYPGRRSLRSFALGSGLPGRWSDEEEFGFLAEKSRFAFFRQPALAFFRLLH